MNYFSRHFLLVFVIFLTIVSACSQSTDRYTKNQDAGYLSIEGLIDASINERIKSFYEVEKLVVSKENESGWHVYPPRESDDPIFDQVPQKLLYDAIGDLRQLKYLSVMDLDLTSLPESISRLTSLDTLNLSLNYLTISRELDKLSQLKKLKYLDIRNNRIDTLVLKKWMSDKPGLKVVY